MKEYKFESLIKKSEIGSGGAYVEFPYDVEKEFGTKGRVKIVCYFENIEYRGSLVKMGTNCHIIGIKKDIRKKLNKEIGDQIQVILIKDESERIIDAHTLLIQEFEKDEILRAKYEQLSYTNKKEIQNHLNGAKKEETLKRRLDKIVTDLRK